MVTQWFARIKIKAASNDLSYHTRSFYFITKEERDELVRCAQEKGWPVEAVGIDHIFVSASDAMVECLEVEAAF